MNNKKFWFFIERELEEITNKLVEPLGLTEFYRDYENVWEWCESIDKEAPIYFDISREHNWEQGCYHFPVILIIRKKELDFSETEIKGIGKIIATTLKVNVFYGSVLYHDDSKYEYVTEIEF